jgi:hypothetical protein
MVFRGRPPKPDPRWQDQLTIRQAIRYLRGCGRGMGYAKIHRAIATGELPAAEDRTRLDRYGKPLLVVTQEAIDTWLNRSLIPIQAMPLAM